jgi:hypothetical protein
MILTSSPVNQPFRTGWRAEPSVVDTEAKREALVLARLVDVADQPFVGEGGDVELRVLEPGRGAVTVGVIAGSSLRRSGHYRRDN